MKDSIMHVMGPVSVTVAFIGLTFGLYYWCCCCGVYGIGFCVLACGMLLSLLDEFLVSAVLRACSGTVFAFFKVVFVDFFPRGPLPRRHPSICCVKASTTLGACAYDLFEGCLLPDQPSKFLFLFFI